MVLIDRRIVRDSDTVAVPRPSECHLNRRAPEHFRSRLKTVTEALIIFVYRLWQNPIQTVNLILQPLDVMLKTLFEPRDLGAQSPYFPSIQQHF